MILTEKILKEGASIRNGWSRKQLQLFGIKWPLKKGWKHIILNRDYPQEKIDRFLALKDKHIASSNRFRAMLNLDPSFFPELTDEEKHLESIKDEIKIAKSCKDCVHHKTGSCEDNTPCKYYETLKDIFNFTKAQI